MLTITTYDWVPDMPRGYVRDIRARWACEEGGLPYSVDTVPLMPKSDAHFARQPFGQVPMLKDGDGDDAVDVFESGAILLYLAGKSDKLMPTDPKGAADVLKWTISALNSVEMWTMPWQMAVVFRKDAKAADAAAGIMHKRLEQLENEMAGREFIAAGRFSVADIILADVLRIVRDEGGLDRHPGLVAYLDRMLARPAFRKVHDEQVAEFEAATPPKNADKLMAGEDGVEKTSKEKTA